MQFPNWWSCSASIIWLFRSLKRFSLTWNSWRFPSKVDEKEDFFSQIARGQIRQLHHHQHQYNSNFNYQSSAYRLLSSKQIDWCLYSLWPVDIAWCSTFRWKLNCTVALSRPSISSSNLWKCLRWNHTVLEIPWRRNTFCLSQCKTVPCHYSRKRAFGL